MNNKEIKVPVQPIGLSVSKGMEISFLYNPPTPSLVVLDEYHILPAETVLLSDGPGVKLFFNVEPKLDALLSRRVSCFWFKAHFTKLDSRVETQYI